MKEVKFSNYYDEVKKSKIPVLLEFYAPWCDHCAEVTPVLEALSEKYKDIVKFCKIDTEEEELLTVKNKIKGLPTVIFLCDGEELHRFDGEKSSEEIQEMIQATFHL